MRSAQRPRQPCPRPAASAQTYAQYAPPAQPHAGGVRGRQRRPAARLPQRHLQLELGTCATTPSAAASPTTTAPKCSPTCRAPAQRRLAQRSTRTSPTTANIRSTTPTRSTATQFYVDATPGAGDVFYNGALAHLGGRRPGRRWRGDLRPRRHQPGRPSPRRQRRKPRHGRVEQHNLSCVEQRQLRPEPGQYLRHPAAAPPARRQLGGDLRQRPGQRHGRCRHLRHDARPETGAQRCAVLLPEHRRRHAPAARNGISYATPADLDGDHVTDFVYAGDIQGNVWRFDLTERTESSWTVTPGPIFNTGGQPITTAMVVASGAPEPGELQQLMMLFGTGQKSPASPTPAAPPTRPARRRSTACGTGTSAPPTAAASGPAPATPVGWDGMSTAQYAALTRAEAGLTPLTTTNLQ